MTPQDIEAELSYVYLHAVASRAGVACQAAARSLDNTGIDATLHLVKDFGPGVSFTEISLHLQLKATTLPPACDKGRLSYFLRETAQYDRLRADTCMPPRLLAVLFLPAEPELWLTLTADQMILRNAAYWVSLVGAPQSANKTGQTVYLPEAQRLSPEGLLELFGRMAREERLRYAS